MRIALGIEYDGSHYHGWQAQKSVQKGLPTVQGELQFALSKIADEPVQLHCAGRTDAGVHATGQVVHFDTEAKRHPDAWIWGTNSHLPKDIAVRWAKSVDYGFHARFSALSRRYRYIIYNNPIRPALLLSKVTWNYFPLNVEAMQNAAPFFLGEQNFNSFRSSECSSNSPMRNITELTISRRNDFVIIEIEANAFLHHMVRNIAGVLMRIGAGWEKPEWAQEVLLAQDRRKAAETAPPHGLYLINVRYPEPYVFVYDPNASDVLFNYN
ncbi:MAG TPA: tRNA pseudouridine(38-40) synthase TruA [Gammaproteobacteria bacterium]|nr:tRNA pseudouridine(38-40) synthase TruA [Gammaproteobacteria bacterium]